MEHLSKSNAISDWLYFHFDAIGSSHNLLSNRQGTNEVYWASNNEVIEISSYRIQHPMTYWSLWASV
jgi:hypothetical protein